MQASVWRNPKNTVHLDIRPCGSGSACGVVIWASPKAQQQAQKGSGKDLVGMSLFRDMEKGKDGAWRGKVFVPDINKTLTGSAQPLDGGKLQAKGCLFANVFCKAQIWIRLDSAAGSKAD